MVIPLSCLLLLYSPKADRPPQACPSRCGEPLLAKRAVGVEQMLRDRMEEGRRRRAEQGRKKRRREEEEEQDGRRVNICTYHIFSCTSK